MNDDDLWIDAALDDELDAAASLAFQRRLENEPALKGAWDERRALRGALRARATYHPVPTGLAARLSEVLGVSTAVAATPDGGGARMDPGAGADADVDVDVDADVDADVDRSADAGVDFTWRANGDKIDVGSAAHDGGGMSQGDRRQRRRPGAGARSRFAAGGAWRPWMHGAIGAVAASLATLLVVDPAALRPGVAGGSAGLRAVSAAESAEAAEAVSAHTRALLVDHPIEVASSDQHTVRPWLSARLNFVPPVVDLAPQGYALLGARRDVLSGETSAALVYRHGAHVISVFVRPAPAGRPAGSDTPLVIRGFNVIQRTQGGMAFCLVSDLNPRELAALADLLAPPGGR
jgi:anti-sigma factor RsiW